jgi:hypothetical protein
MDTTKHQFGMLHANANKDIKKQTIKKYHILNEQIGMRKLPCSEKCQEFQNQHHLHLALLNGCTKIDIKR